MSEPLSLYQIIITAIALLNLALTIGAMRAASHKAASETLTNLETSLRTQLQHQDIRISRLEAAADGAVTHDHLATVYDKMNAIAQLLHTLDGNQQQMNELLRQLLAKELRG